MLLINAFIYNVINYKLILIPVYSFRLLEKGCSRGRPAHGRSAVFPLVKVLPSLLIIDCPVCIAVKVELYM